MPSDHSRGEHLTKPAGIEVIHGPPLPATGLRPGLADVRALDLLPAQGVLEPAPTAYGVLVLVSQHFDGLAQLHMTRRPPHMRQYPNQVVFPGGKFDPADCCLLRTAQRETEEEVCLAPTGVDIIGALPMARAVPGGQRMYPFVGVVPATVKLCTGEEVCEILTVTLAELLEPGAYRRERWADPDEPEVHVFTLGKRSIEGGTAQILVSLLTLLTP